MLRSIVFCALFGLMTVVTSIPTIPNDFAQALVIDVNPEALQSISQLKDPFGWKNIFGVDDDSEKNDASDATNLLTASQLTVVPSTQVGGIRRYTIGKRVAHDRLVGRGADSKRWATPQDVTLALKYPTSGQGAIVTYAEVVVNQSSDIGSAYVVAGGIGQHSIAIAVVAKSTLWFSYTVNIYGL